MRTNRSVPNCILIPELAYADVTAAAAWLCDCFGFQLRLRIGNHRAQLVCGDAAMVAMDYRGHAPAPAGAGTHGLLMRVANVDRHHAHAVARGVTIVRPPADYPYGERQYTAVDLGGHHWTFSETIADADPASWGGELANAQI
jgi:uncharacterized glyoxalase superfamily protein PhnB